jgi:hypothetical protein
MLRAALVSARSFGLCIAAAALLAGCTSVPPLQRDDKPVQVYEIVERVKCELAVSLAKRSLDQRLTFLQRWAVTVDLSLLVDTNSGLNPGVSIINPLAAGESFTLGLGLGSSARAIRQEQVKFKLPVKEVWNDYSGRVSGKQRLLPVCDLQDTDGLNSDLGFDEWFVSVLGPLDGRGNAASIQLRHLKSISHEVNFIVTASVSATPNWNLVRFRGPGLGSGGGSSSGGGGNNNSLLSLARTDNHKMTMTLAPDNDKGDRDASDALILNRLQTIFVPQ